MAAKHREYASCGPVRFLFQAGWTLFAYLLSCGSAWSAAATTSLSSYLLPDVCDGGVLHPPLEAPEACISPISADWELWKGGPKGSDPELPNPFDPKHPLKPPHVPGSATDVKNALDAAKTAVNIAFATLGFLGGKMPRRTDDSPDDPPIDQPGGSDDDPKSEYPTISTDDPYLWNTDPNAYLSEGLDTRPTIREPNDGDTRTAWTPSSPYREGNPAAGPSDSPETIEEEAHWRGEAGNPPVEAPIETVIP